MSYWKLSWTIYRAQIILRLLPTHAVCVPKYYYSIQIFWFLRVGKGFLHLCNLFVFVSSLEGGTFSLHLRSLLPPCCSWPSFLCGQFFWGCVPLFLGLGTLWCCAEAEPRKSARFTITILKHFVPFSCVSSEAIGSVAQGFRGGMLCLAGRASKTYFYLCQVLHIIYKLVSPPWLETT